MAFANLVVKISGNIESLDRSLKLSVERVKSLGNSLSSVGSTLSLGITAPVAAFGAAALKSAGNIEALKLGLTAITGSSSEAARQLKDLREVAKLPGLGFQEAVQGAINLQAVGFSAKQSQTILLQFGNALASVGRGRADLDEVIRQLGQLASRGKVTADNLKPIIERVPQVATIIKREFGTIDTEALQKLGISSQQLIKVLIDGLSDLQRTNGGIKNEFENLSDNITIALAEAGEALKPFAITVLRNFAEPTIEAVKNAAQSFQQLPDSAKTAIVGLGGFAVAAPVVVTALGVVISNLAILAETLAKVGGVAGIAAAALKAIPYVAIAGSIASIGYAYLGYRDAAKSAADADAEFADSLQRTVIALKQQGVKGLDDLNKAYLSGQISQDAFAKKLRELAVEHGKTVTPIKQQTEALFSGGEAAEQAAEKLQKYKRVSAEMAVPIRVLVEASRQLEASQQATISTAARFKLEQDKLVDVTKDYADALDQLPPQLRDADKDIRKLGESSAYVQQQIQDVVGALRSIDVGVSGKSIKIAVEDATKAGKEMEQEARTSTRAAAREWNSLGRQVSLVTNDLARNLTDLAFKGGKFKDVMVGMVQDIAKALLRAALERQFTKIADVVGGLLTKIPVLGKALDKVFGVGGGAASAAGSIGSAAGGAASAAGSVAGGAGSAAGGVASAAGSGVAGIVGAVGSVVTAVSSVISNFQFAGMNKSLDLIVKHTLETSRQLVGGVQPSLNQYLPVLVQLHDRLVEIKSSGIGVYNAPGDQGLRLAGAGGGAGAATYNFNFAGATFGAGTSQGQIEQFMREAIRKAQLAGA